MSVVIFLLIFTHVFFSLHDEGCGCVSCIRIKKVSLWKIIALHMTLLVITGRGKGFFSSLCVQTSSEAHPASYSMGTSGLFLGVKRGRGMMLTTYSYLVPREEGRKLTRD
jgi:hypothetical protein